MSIRNVLMSSVFVTGLLAGNTGCEQSLDDNLKRTFKAKTEIEQLKGKNYLDSLYNYYQKNISIKYYVLTEETVHIDGQKLYEETCVAKEYFENELAKIKSGKNFDNAKNILKDTLSTVADSAYKATAKAAKNIK